ncbi:MAG: F0F1 ATP synthase subunit delta [Halieaceae bacterium]
MAELSTLARPYAKAAFEYALAKGALPGWSEALATVAQVSQDATMASILGSPAYTAAQMADTVIDVCGDTLDADLQNYVRVLASNKRLLLLPEICSLFDQYKANQEKSVDVTVSTAYALEESTEQTLAQVLSKKLEREVRVESLVDQSLLGGVLIRAGDLVIDGSVRGRLNKLAEAMNS